MFSGLSSVLLLTCSIATGTLESLGLLPSCSIITIALHNTIIPIIPRLSTSTIQDHVKHLYFASRRTGVFPRWYSMEGYDSVQEEKELMKKYDTERREMNVQVCLCLYLSTYLYLYLSHLYLHSHFTSLLSTFYLALTTK